MNFNEQLEETLEKYEAAFQQGTHPGIADYVSACDNSMRYQLLTELLISDLELRIRSGESRRVESYLEEFPEVKDDASLVGELLRTEIRTRLQFENELDPDEYETRFSIDYHEVIGSVFSEWRETIETGTIEFANRFRKINLHRQGGLGNVWVGHDADLQRRVAIKEVKGKFTDDEQLQIRFARESLVTAQLEHPGIVPVYGKGRLANGKPYYAMRFIEGETLEHEILRFHDVATYDGRLDFQRLLRIFLDVCSAVAFAHSRGVVHRDIKPTNVMVGKFGETLLVDWGLAKLLDDFSGQLETSSPQFNRTFFEQDSLSEDSIFGNVIGSPAFMSPEQASGNNDQVGIHSDIYSLGATLLVMLTGEKTPGKPDGTARKTVKLMGLNVRPLLSICHKSMSPRQEDRYQSVLALQQDVESFLADQKVAAHDESFPERIGRLNQRHQGLATVASAAMGLLALISLIAFLQVSKQRNRAVLAKDKEIKARLVADDRTYQLKGVVEVVSNLLGGPAVCGFDSDATLEEGMNYMVSRADDDEFVRQLPIVRGTLFGLKAKYLKGQNKFKDAADWYQRAISTMTEQPAKGTSLASHALPTNDPMVLELSVGLSTATAKSGDPATGLQIAESICEKIGNTDSDKEKERLKFAALTAMITPLWKAGRKEEAFQAIHEAIDIGGNCYPAHHHHYCHALRILAHLHIQQKENDKAIEYLKQVMAGYRSNPQVSAKTVSQVELNLGLLQLKAGDYEQGASLLDLVVDQASELYESDDPKLAEIRRVVANAKRRHAPR